MDTKESHNSDIKHIPEKAFNYLRKCCLCDESESRFLRLKSWRGLEVLQVQNYAGVVRCPDGTDIEILPKMAKSFSNSNDVSNEDLQGEARKSLLMMLKTLKQFRHIKSEIAGIEKQKMPLLEVFVAQFLASVNDLVKKGIKNDYVQEQSNSAFLKGKLLASQQLRHNFVNRHKFYVEYDEYLPDRAENRLIHSALAKVASYTRLNRHQKLAKELLFAFADVPLSRQYRDDFASVRVNRGMAYYDTPLSWVKLILDGFSPQAMSGDNEAYSLLFPMEAVFESFVASWLKKELAGQVRVTSQLQNQYLVHCNGTPYFKLKPDLEFTWDNKQENTKQENKRVILDTKWKMLDAAKSSGTDKFGLSQQDFYQMLGYGHKYLNGSGEMVLIYPKTADFQEPLPHSFKYDGRLKLRVVPFDISHQCDVRIDLSQIGINC